MIGLKFSAIFFNGGGGGGELDITVNCIIVRTFTFSDFTISYFRHCVNVMYPVTSAQATALKDPLNAISNRQ